MQIDGEFIAIVAGLTPVVIKFLRSQSRLTTVAEHAIKQNADIMATQARTTSALTGLVQDLSERIGALEALHEEEGETVVQGFRTGDDAEDDQADDEQEEDDDPGAIPLNVRKAAVRKQG